jgi:omega-6 fatty acid desaturase (delta-12 desaturase)
MRACDSKELLRATRPFAQEIRWLSWWHLWSTLAVLGASLCFLCTDYSWLVRLPVSILAGLTIVRWFVLYHDHQHGAILRKSKLADGIMFFFGLAALNPPSVWKRSHDHHHNNNCKSFGPNVGSYPLVTVETYAGASFKQRLLYAAARHPLTMLFAYATVFLGGMSIVPFLANPRRHFDAALAVLCHAGILLWLAFDEFDDLWLAAIIPCAIGSAVGAYLFYAQHNFPGAKIRTGKDWDYTSAALLSSSYLRMGPAMRWFTGNIGYHHVHHLNSKIPFYRLPEAMAAIEALQSPTVVTLWPRDIIACLRLKLWNPAADRLVGWHERPAAPIAAHDDTPRLAA